MNRLASQPVFAGKSGSAPPTADSVIKAARAGWRLLDEGTTGFTSEFSFVNLCLRDQKLPVLTDAQAAALGISSVPGEVPAVMASDRSATISTARRSFAAEKASGKTLLCSEKAWVHTALRDKRMGPLSENEVREFSIQEA